MKSWRKWRVIIVASVVVVASVVMGSGCGGTNSSLPNCTPNVVDRQVQLPALWGKKDVSFYAKSSTHAEITFSGDAVYNFWVFSPEGQEIYDGAVDNRGLQVLVECPTEGYYKVEMEISGLWARIVSVHVKVLCY